MSGVVSFDLLAKRIIEKNPDISIAIVEKIGPRKIDLVVHRFVPGQNMLAIKTPRKVTWNSFPRAFPDRRRYEMMVDSFHQALKEGRSSLEYESHFPVYAKRRVRFFKIAAYRAIAFIAPIELTQRALWRIES